MKKNITSWFQAGSAWIWLNAGAVTISVAMVFGLLAFIGFKGAVYFWPSDVVSLRYQLPGYNEQTLIGEIKDTETVSAVRVRESGVELAADKDFVERHLLKTGNRDVTGKDFRWIIEDYVSQMQKPEEILVLERREWGHYYGYLKDVLERGVPVAAERDLWSEVQRRIARANELHKKISLIEKKKIGSINHALEQDRLQRRLLELEQVKDPTKWAALDKKRAELNQQYDRLQVKLESLYKRIERDQLIMQSMDGSEQSILVSKIVKAYKPNGMHVMAKLWLYWENFVDFISAEPREANTEGGIFPAIFGTVVMVMIMSIIVTPFGVVAAIYLREYATQGLVTKTIRIAVNNLAGVPSIVYGVFGLGFFVYVVGGSIDDLFYPEAAPAPVFGTPGLLWASVTLALLTVPVVIVSTEEGLARIPKSIREGSLALGATKAETLWRVILPMSSPAIMTGLILAVARAAGEVAPLMLVGVVKLAPSLPIDGNFPFVHLERKFMHLGFHIYDVGFQSPNVEAARPLVYATSFLLVIVIATLNLLAVMLRNRLREKYKTLES